MVIAYSPIVLIGSSLYSPISISVPPSNLSIGSTKLEGFLKWNKIAVKGGCTLFARTKFIKSFNKPIFIVLVTLIL